MIFVGEIFDQPFLIEKRKKQNFKKSFYTLLIIVINYQQNVLRLFVMCFHGKTVVLYLLVNNNRLYIFIRDLFNKKISHTIICCLIIHVTVIITFRTQYSEPLYNINNLFVLLSLISHFKIT